MIEAKFPARLRSGGSTKVITIPKDVIELYSLDDSGLYEIVIRKIEKTRNELCGIPSRDLCSFTSKIRAEGGK